MRITRPDFMREERTPGETPSCEPELRNQGAVHASKVERFALYALGDPSLRDASGDIDDHLYNELQAH